MTETQYRVVRRPPVRAIWLCWRCASVEKVYAAYLNDEFRKAPNRYMKAERNLLNMRKIPYTRAPTFVVRCGADNANETNKETNEQNDY